MRISDWSSDVCSSDLLDVFDFLNRLRVLALATHLGDNRTLVLPMAHTIYYEMGPETRALMGISDNFLRVSIGIEDIQDLVEDFHQALASEGGAQLMAGGKIGRAAGRGRVCKGG